MKMPFLPLAPRRRPSDGAAALPSLGYRERLLLSELEAGRLSTAADARAAIRAAQRCGRHDLVRRADRVRVSLAASRRLARRR